MKTYLKCYSYFFSLIIILTFLLSIASYLFNKEFTIIKIIIPFISVLIASIILGKNSNKLAYYEGIKFSIFYLIFSLLIELLIFKYPFNYKFIIYYIAIIIISSIGSMIGINTKNKSE